MSQRFPIQPAPPANPNFSIGITIPGVPAAPPAPSGACTPSGPFIPLCVNQFPDADSKLFVLTMFGLSETDVVTWAVTLGGADRTVGALDRHVLLIQYEGGFGDRLVTATVNGTVFGPFEYATNDQRNECVAIDPGE